MISRFEGQRTKCLSNLLCLIKVILLTLQRFVILSLSLSLLPFDVTVITITVVCRAFLLFCNFITAFVWQSYLWHLAYRRAVSYLLFLSMELISGGCFLLQSRLSALSAGWSQADQIYKRAPSTGWLGTLSRKGKNDTSQSSRWSRATFCATWIYRLPSLTMRYAVVKLKMRRSGTVGLVRGPRAVLAFQKAEAVCEICWINIFGLGTNRLLLVQTLIPFRTSAAIAAP